jgi:pilus assembly protein CpaE
MTSSFSTSPFSAIANGSFFKAKKADTERTLPRVALFADAEDLLFDPSAINIPASISVFSRNKSQDGVPDDMDAVAICVPSSINAAVEAVTRMARVPVIALVDRAEPAMVEALFRAGVADVLPLPLSTDALSLTLHRINARRPSATLQTVRRGRIVSVMSASGGMGATSVLVNLAHILNQRTKAGASLALVDLDIQSGICATLMDLQSGGTVTDLFSSGGFGDVDVMREAFSRHPSGIRLLAAPQDITPLESLEPGDVDRMLKTASQAFDLTFVDLPNAWTAWSDAALRLCDTIVLVVTADVAGVHQARRQLRMMSAQGLDDKPLLLVANKARTGWNGGVDFKDCEKSIGRKFDAILPADEDVMRAAANQGVAISAIRKGTKLEKAMSELADAVLTSMKRGA